MHSNPREGAGPERDHAELDVDWAKLAMELLKDLNTEMSLFIYPWKVGFVCCACARISKVNNSYLLQHGRDEKLM